MRCNTTLIKDRIIEAKNAVEKLSITNPESIKDCVMVKVFALINRINNTPNKDKIIEAKNDVEKLTIKNPESIKECVMVKVIALITRMNKPRVSTVIGMVRIISIGLTMIFSIDKIIAAINAILKPAI